MGRIESWARIAATVPALANAVLQAPLLGPAAKRVAGIAAERPLPRFAPEPFTAWFYRRRARRGAHAPAGPRVMLWPDTFNNYFRPHTAIAATRVLEALGCEVVLPEKPLCCGRPLYDWGWLDRAQMVWRRTMTALRDDIDAGTSIVGLEPACVSAFKDELTNLFPDDERARRLSRQAVFFSDFVADRLAPVAGSQQPKALVQTHCHQHAIIKTDGERKLMERLGLDYEMLASGCCGMAGAYGMEADKYEVSLRIGERVLLPRVREAGPGTLILANGFSCREQIEQCTGRTTQHIAEVAAQRMPLL